MNGLGELGQTIPFFFFSFLKITYKGLSGSILEQMTAVEDNRRETRLVVLRSRLGCLLCLTGFLK